MKRFLLLFVVVLMVNSCEEPDPVAIHGHIAGVVTEAGTNTPIKGVNVAVTGIEQSHITGDDGSYKILDLPADDYSVTVLKRGYIANTKTYTVVAERTTQGNFSLVKDLPIVHPAVAILSNAKLTESFELENTRSGEMEFTAETSKTWLKLNPTKGIIPSLNKRIISLDVDVTNLPFGNYSELLVINVGEASLSIPIQITYEQPPFIEMATPKKDEIHKMGETMPINWSSNLTGKVQIDLMQFSSIKAVISKECENNKGGSFTWSIPALDSAHYQIKITSLENSSINAISDAFKIIEGPTPPIVITGNATEVTSNQITISGTITSIGKKMTKVDQYGHVYSKANPLPTIADHKTTLGAINEPSSFSSQINPLEPGQSYYIRAYATNSKGTAYGELITVTTSANLALVQTSDVISIQQSSAQTGGTIISDGGNSITERGICWGKASPVTVDANIIKDGSNTIGTFTTSMSGLEKATQYYVRAYAKNSSGTAYGDEKFFRTLGGLPEVLTVSTSSLSATKVSVTGNVQNDGGESITAYGFCYSKNPSPTIGDYKIEMRDELLGEFISTIENLQPETNYYIRAYATNKIGTSYGEEKNIQTLNGLPSVSTRGANVISATKVAASGSILSNGGEEITSYGFCYSKTSSPTIDDSKYEVGKNATGDFSENIENLEPETNYFIRAYATNRLGTTYGEEFSFTTVSGGYVSFISPFKGEEYMPGETHRISWETNYSARRIIIEHWDGGILTEISNNSNIGTKYFDWYISKETPIGYNNQIKIIDYNTLEVIGESSTFTIPGDLSITRPLENSIAEIESFKIEWVTNFSNTVRIDLYKGSQFVLTIANSINAQDGSYTWDAKLNGIDVGGNYRVKISDNDNADFFKLSGLFEFVEDASIFTDPRDLQTYKIVEIGNLLWFAQDLNYRGNKEYTNAAAIESCPLGWRLPTDEEWKEMERYLGMFTDDSNFDGDRLTGEVGKKLKSSAMNGTDEVGFNAKAIDTGTVARYWSSTTVGGYYGDYNYYRQLSTTSDGVYRSFIGRNSYLQVRCVKSK